MAGKNVSPKKYCSDCKKEYTLKNFYSTDPLMFPDSKLHICIKCCGKRIDEHGFTAFKSLLRIINKPFLKELYKDNPASYIRQINSLPQYRGMTYDDSNDFTRNMPMTQDVDESPIEISDLKTLRKTWGDYGNEDYEFLENFYKEYSHSYKTDTPVQVNLYRNIAKVHLQAEKELSSGNVKQFKDLMDLSSKLHNDGNIKPIQSTGANDDKGLSTYGLWVKTIEQDEPCEYFEGKPVYEDHDKFKKYIDNWFVRPFKNIFNISKDFNVRDE